MKIYITLAELKSLGPCQGGLRHLLRGIDYDKRCADEDVIIPLDLIYRVNGSNDVRWLLDQWFHHGQCKGLPPLQCRLINKIVYRSSGRAEDLALLRHYKRKA